MDDAEHAETEETEVAPVADEAPTLEAPHGSEPAAEAEPEQSTGTDEEDDEPTAPLTLDELVAEISDVEPSDAAAAAEGEEAEEAAEGEGAEEAEEGEEPDSEQEGSETAESEAEGEELTPEEEYGPTPVVSRMWARVPFWIIGLVWAAFAGALGYLLWPVSAGVFVTDPLYPYFAFGGAALVALGLVTGLIVWLVARAKADGDERVGLGRILWMRALSWTAGGVVLWWVALIALDLHRTGVIR